MASIWKVTVRIGTTEEMGEWNGMHIGKSVEGSIVEMVGVSACG